jgi:hypothetical protein
MFLRPIYDFATDAGYERSWKFSQSHGWMEWIEAKGRWIACPNPSTRAIYSQSRHSIAFYGFVAP